jgi:hypothetical protein
MDARKIFLFQLLSDGSDLAALKVNVAATHKKQFVAIRIF